MSLRLRSYDHAPPGGYPFEEHGRLYRKFPSVPLIEDQARNVEAYRKANGLPRATFQEALRDVDRYQCIRLGGMSDFCVETSSNNKTVALNRSSPYINPPCKGCGMPMTQK